MDCYGKFTVQILLFFWLACSVGCPSGEYEQKACSNYGDRSCQGMFTLLLLYNFSKNSLMCSEKDQVLLNSKERYQTFVDNKYFIDAYVLTTFW